MAPCKGFEALPIAGLINRIRRGTHDGQIEPVYGQIRQTSLERQGEVDGGLTPKLKQYSMGLLPK